MDPLKLGQKITCTIVNAKGGKRFEVNSKETPRGWKVELHTREPEEYEIGERYQFWIARITPIKSEVLVHDGDFGRLPISEKMNKRYLEAIEVLLGEKEIAGDALGDAAAMVSRIGTQNQADWLTVWQVLGEPKPGEIKHLLEAINKLRAARKYQPEDVPTISAELRETYGDRLARTAKRLRSAQIGDSSARAQTPPIV
ncbi:MAG: hypothetical protein ABL949_17010 [Fimbriimonadaceae bacterium]